MRLKFEKNFFPKKKNKKKIFSNFNPIFHLVKGSRKRVLTPIRVELHAEQVYLEAQSRLA